MYEKVNPSHPDKVADRIAGAVVDLCYKKNRNPKAAVEVLIGHGVCHIICETSEKLNPDDVRDVVRRIAGDIETDYVEVPQDEHLAKNQDKNFRCGDNGIFKGVPVKNHRSGIRLQAQSNADSVERTSNVLLPTIKYPGIAVLFRNKAEHFVNRNQYRKQLL